MRPRKINSTILSIVVNLLATTHKNGGFLFNKSAKERESFYEKIYALWCVVYGIVCRK